MELPDSIPTYRKKFVDLHPPVMISCSEATECPRRSRGREGSSWASTEDVHRIQGQDAAESHCGGGGTGRPRPNTRGSMIVTDWKKEILGAQSLDDLCKTLNQAVGAYESNGDAESFQSFIGLSGTDWTKLPLFGPDDWGLPQGVYSWDARGNVLVRDNNVWQVVPLQEIQPLFYSGFDVAVEWDEDRDAWIVHGPHGQIAGQYDTPWEALRAFERPTSQE